MKRILQIGILTALLWILFPLVLQAAPVGKVTAIEGEVDLTASGKEAKPVTPGDAVNVGDFIRTKSRSKCEVTFIDGNILRLAESTRIQVSEYMIENDKRQETIGLLRGKIRSIVQKGIHALGTERGGHHEVRTPTAVLGVRGSDNIYYYLNGISGGIFTQGSGYGYPLGNPGLIQNYGTGQMLMIIGINLPPIVQTVNQQQIDQHIYDTNIGSGSGGVTTTTAATTTGTTAETTVATTVAPLGPPSGTTTPTTVVTGGWTGNPYDRSLLPAAFIQPSTTVAATTSVVPMTTVLPTTTVMTTTVQPTTTATTVPTTTTVATTSTTTVGPTTTTTVPPTTTVATTSTSTTTAQSTTTTTVLPTTTTVATTTSTSTTSTTTTSIPAGAEPINGNITGLFANPVVVSGHAFNTGAAGSVTVNSTDTVPGNPWPIARFAGTYGGGTFDGYFTGVTGSWEGLYHAIYFDDGGTAGYTWGGMGDPGTVFTGTGPTYGGTTMGTAVGTTLSAWSTMPPPRFGNITIIDGSSTFGPTGGTFSSAMKGVNLVSGQSMGVWGTTNTGSFFTTDGSASWNGIFFQGDANYQMVGRIYGTTSGNAWSIGPSGGGDPSALYYLDTTHYGKLILNYRAKGSGGAYVMAGAGSFFLDLLLYASTLNAPAISGPQNLDTAGRMGMLDSDGSLMVHFLGKSALPDQSVWMNSIQDSVRNVYGTIIGYKQMGTNTGGGDFSHQGNLFGIYSDGGDVGYKYAVTTDDYNSNSSFKMSGTLDYFLMGSGGTTAVDPPQNITSSTSQYSTGQFKNFTGQNWGIFSSYLTGTTWPTEFITEANNGNLFHTLNMDASGGVPPAAPSGSPTGSRIGEMPVSGAWMNISEAMTGISGGQLYYQGPVTPSTTWTAVAAGGWIETNRFIALRGSLDGSPSNTALFDALKIPYTYIGQVALSGSSSPSIPTLNMTAYFYGYSAGTPSIFVSNNVTGMTMGNPTGTSVTLSGPTGSGFTNNVAFTFTNWNTSTNKWAATVNTTSSGQLNPPSGPRTYMNGYSAGSFTPSTLNTLNGTAAGAAYPMRAF